jgi:hypothetical protein
MELHCLFLAVVLAVGIHLAKRSVVTSPGYRKWRHYRKLVRKHHFVRGSLIYALGG